jgi:hypothetical protein
LVVGFFSPVEDALKVEFQPELDSGALVFLGKSSPQQAFDIHKFKSKFFHLCSTNDPDPILVIAAEVRGLEWAIQSLIGIVDSGRLRGREIVLQFFANAQDANRVVDALLEFQLRHAPGDANVSEATLRNHGNGKRVFCVRSQGQAGFEEVLRRAGFQFARFEEHFVELDLAYGPNVARTVATHAPHHDTLLYAWGELKYMQPADKRKWKAVHQGQTPAAAAARFKQAVLGSTNDGQDDN